ncbi:WXG100 family type VII secretion target [Nocardia beijingensis]|uniref:WXG100 family type VII secretion target n=1 Tax=Nocardia beijingensis TaxID=95162 RepID=UPI001893E917|nr:WXG100 family type VII secretion target [Nocardia beijingensis]MBF6469834.1 WXG100 family type VII secretion target [Nocardia beijingensis]
MDEKFSVDPDKLRDHAPRFDMIGADVAATVQKLRAALAGEGEPWGKDDAGRAFAESYVPEYQRTMTDLNSLVEALQQAGTDLRHLAENFEIQDQAVGRRIQNAATAFQNDPAGHPLSVDAGPAHRLGLSATDVPTAAQSFAASPVPTAAVAAAAPRPPASAAAAPADRSPLSSAPPDRTPGAPGNGPASDHRPGQAEGNPNGQHSAGQPGSPGPSVNPARQAEAALTRPAAGSRPSSPWTKATAATSQTAAAQAAATQAAGKKAGAVGPSTPWSNAAAGRPPKVSAPDAGTPGSPPRVPGRPTARPDQKDEKPDRKVNASAESVAARLARELAERHGVRAFGFDTPGIAVEALTEIVAAVDDVLPRYPQITLRAIGIEELPDGETALLKWDSMTISEAARESDGACDSSGKRFPRAAEGLSAARIVLAVRAATDPRYLQQTVAIAEDAGLLAQGCAQRPAYSTVVRELGRALDGAGGFRARAAAQRALLTAYLPQLNPEDKGSLRRTVSGFREWRSQLHGHSFDRGRFRPATALAEAFTDVVLNATQAAPPAQVLHRLLVTTANSPTPP